MSLPTDDKQATASAEETRARVQAICTELGIVDPYCIQDERVWYEFTEDEMARILAHIAEEPGPAPAHPRCLCCGAALADPAARCGAWCMSCHDSALGELLQMGDLPSGERFIVVGMFHAVGAETCARVVTRVPFGERPSQADFDRLAE